MVRGSLDEVLDDAPFPGPSRRDIRQKKTRKRKRRRGWVAVLITLGIFGAAVYGAYAGLRPLIESFDLGGPKDYEGAGAGQVTVVIPPGATGGQIGRILESEGVVMNASAFVKTASGDLRATSIQPGTYELRKQMSSAAALEILVDAQNRIVSRVTIKEGARIGQVRDLLVKNGKFDKADVDAALKDAEAIGLPKAAKGKAEGFLFPATYEFEPGTTAVEAVRTMVAKNAAVLEELGVPASKQREVIIKASIVQAEGGSVEDFGKIARVIENREKIGMRLQMDSTAAYGAGVYKVLTSKAERMDPANKYSTYAHDGLPIGPIGNPGEEAIKAVLDPTNGNWLYFVVVNFDTRETAFAATGAGHQANIAKMQKWLRENR